MAQAFKDDSHTKVQQICFKNGVAEPSIQAVVEWTQTMLHTCRCLFACGS